jgi:Protein of unknown function (DUF1579)
MKPTLFVTSFIAAASLASSSFAQTSPAPGSKVSSSGQVPVPANTNSGAPATAPGQPSAADTQKMMQQMMELSKTNENHKLLSSMDGNWDYTVKFSPGPGAPEQVSKGVATRKSMMGGRYCTMEVSGNMQMPDETGKPKNVQFKGMALEGYDNVKKKFVSSWIDNMGTGIMNSEGTYDPATKAFTYTGEIEAIPGMKQKIREVVKLTDKDHMNLEWYEDRGGQETKTMEIAYTRKK